MKLTTNIVLTGNQGRTQSYMVQMTPNQPEVGDFVFQRYNGVDHHAVLYTDSVNSQLIKDGNNWYRDDVQGTVYQLHTANIRLYFPQYSIDTFDKKITYILSLSTYIHGVELKLGNFEVKRKNALACAPVRFAGMDEYYEYMDFSIADPSTVLFENEAEPIRTDLGSTPEVSDDSSLLYVCLYAVEETADGYTLRNDWGSGQNSLFLSETRDMSLTINYNAENCTVHMHLNYPGTPQKSLIDYINKTYNSEYTAILWECVIMDDENIYFSTHDITYAVWNSFNDSFDYSFSIADIAVDNDAVTVGNVFESWDDWKDGLYIRGSLSFVQNITEEEYENDDYIPYVSVLSNKLPVTQDMFAMLINGDTFPSKIDLASIDMINLKAVNKVIQNVTVVTPTDSTKSHLIQPVFYQTGELNKIVIHPSVTENIAINLDNYKPQVTRFKLQVEGIVFNEIGRTSKGIIFKVYGNMLPKNTDEGTMYILDQDSNLVTTGKYNYIY